jgi:hypothetical protein
MDEDDIDEDAYLLEYTEHDINLTDVNGAPSSMDEDGEFLDG